MTLTKRQEKSRELMTASPVIPSYHIEVRVLYDLIYLQTQEIAII